MHVRPPATRREKTRSGKKGSNREMTTPRQRTTTHATIVVVNPATRKRNARRTAKTATSVGKLATSAVYAELIHPEEVEVEAVVVRDPEVRCGRATTRRVADDAEATPLMEGVVSFP